MRNELEQRFIQLNASIQHCCEELDLAGAYDEADPVSHAFLLGYVRMSRLLSKLLNERARIVFKLQDEFEIEVDDVG